MCAQPPCGPPHPIDSSRRAHPGSEANIRYGGCSVHPCPHTKHIYNVGGHLPSKLRHPFKHILGEPTVVYIYTVKIHHDPGACGLPYPWVGPTQW
jgi:hypothetical protein